MLPVVIRPNSVLRLTVAIILIFLGGCSLENRTLTFLEEFGIPQGMVPGLTISEKGSRALGDLWFKGTISSKEFGLLKTHLIKSNWEFQKINTWESDFDLLGELPRVLEFGTVRTKLRRMKIYYSATSNSIVARSFNHQL